MRTFAVRLVIAATLLVTAPAWASIIELSRWHMGEPGSMSGALALDSVSPANHMNNAFNNSVQTATPPPVGSSTAYQHLSGGSLVSGTWIFNGVPQTLPADNYGMELWARATDLTDINTYRILMTLGDQTGAFEIGVRDDLVGGVQQYWYAARAGQAYIVPPTAAGGAVANADTWYNLALVRNGGVNQFYVNGMLAGGTDPTAPINNGNVHFGLQSGTGGHNFVGDLDEARIFTFNPGQFSAADLLFNEVPEPSSLAVTALGAGLALWRRRRRT